MSGICGLVRLDGGPASVEQLAPVYGALAFRGPDGGGMWAEGPVALGFRLLATTPEAATEPMPLRHPESGCVVVADARLDNRDELAAALGVQQAGRGDGELILLAYLKWGGDAPLHLLGDFAFAIWDGRRRRLFAARDPVGMRQLHYAHLPGKLLVFGTDDHVLLRHPQVPRRLNEARIADLLEDLEGADLEGTFYEDINRLPPAHALQVEHAHLALRRYWLPEPQSPLHLSSDSEYAEAFLSAFEQSVSSRLRSSEVPASMLSGGIDSSSVTTVAAHLHCPTPLPIFSAVAPDDPDCVESAMIRTVQRTRHFNPCEVTPAFLRQADKPMLTPLSGRNPFDGHMPLIAEIYATASSKGFNVLLDGGAADVVLDHRAFVPRLLRQGRLRRAWSECRGATEFWQLGGRPTAMFLREIRVALIPDWARHLKSHAKTLRDRALPRSPILQNDFAVQIGIGERRETLRQAVPPPGLPYSVDRAQAILHPNVTVARERYDRVASSCGIEARDPFLDRRLLTFVLSLPGEQLLRDGWPKWILRAAMAGRLPDTVRWRRGKTHLGRKFIAAISQAEQSRRQTALDASRDKLATWIRPDVLSQVDGTSPDYGPYDRIVHLAQWLQTHGFVDRQA